MSVPKYRNPREFTQGIAELQALVRPDAVNRVFDILTGLIEYTDKCAVEGLADYIVRETRDGTGRAGVSAKWDAINEHAEMLARRIRATYELEVRE